MEDKDKDNCLMCDRYMNKSELDNKYKVCSTCLNALNNNKLVLLTEEGDSYYISDYKDKIFYFSGGGMIRFKNDKRLFLCRSSVELLKKLFWE